MNSGRQSDSISCCIYQTKENETNQIISNKRLKGRFERQKRYRFLIGIFVLWSRNTFSIFYFCNLPQQRQICMWLRVVHEKHAEFSP